MTHTLLAYVLRRLVWLVVSAWIVMSFAFFLFVVAPDPNIALVRWAAGPSEEAQRAAIEAYRSMHNYDVPVLERYVKWMGNYATLQWGETLDGEPVRSVIGDSLKVTLTYLLPALLVSTVAALGIGVFIATRQGGIADRLATGLAYAGYNVPVFFAGEFLFGLLVYKYGMVRFDMNRQHDLYSATNIDVFLLPALIMTVHLLTVQLVFVRSEVLDHMDADFMKTLDAGGAGPLDRARHALRNAAIPLTSAFFAEILGLLYLSVIVIEVVFGLPGFGAVTIGAIRRRDIALILGTTFVPLLVGLVGNFIQDLAYTVLDPRIEYEEE